MVDWCCAAVVLVVVVEGCASETTCVIGGAFVGTYCVGELVGAGGGVFVVTYCPGLVDTAYSEVKLETIEKMEGLVELTVVMMPGWMGVVTGAICVKVCQIVSYPPSARQSYSKKAPGKAVKWYVLT